MAATAITKAARVLATAERKFARVQTKEAAFIAKATAKAQDKYGKRLTEAAAAVAAAKKTLQDLVAAA